MTVAGGEGLAAGGEGAWFKADFDRSKTCGEIEQL